MRVHDAIFAAACVAGTASLIAIYVGASEREANKIVVSLDPFDELKGEDSEQIQALMSAVKPLAADPSKPDVVVILMDGVRGAAVDPSSPETALMPALSAWAADARRWPAAVASSTSEVSTRASILTGLSPSEHRLRRGPRGDFGRIRWDERALASRFEDEGYLTLGVSAHRLETSRRHATSRGFERFVDLQLPLDPDRLPYTRADRLTEAALSMADAAGDAPLFLWVNYSDAQVPWMPWEDWIEAPLELMDSVIWTPTGGRGSWKRRRRALLAGEAEKAPSEYHLQTWRTLWEGELLLMDQEISRLLAGLSERGLDDRVIVTGTNGVSLGEHGLLGAELGLYQEAISVPLLARAPGLAPGDAPGAPDSTDVNRLIRSFIEEGLDAEIDDLAVSEAWFARAEDLEDDGYGARFNGVRRAFIDGDHKLIIDSLGAVEAYDLSADPEELSPLEGADWIEPMRAEAEAWTERAMHRGGAPARPPEVSAEDAPGDTSLGGDAPGSTP